MPEINSRKDRFWDSSLDVAAESEGERFFETPAPNYIPKTLRGTPLEKHHLELRDILHKQKDQAAAFDYSVHMSEGRMKEALMDFKNITPDVAATMQRIADTKGVPFRLLAEMKLTDDEYVWGKALEEFQDLLEVDEKTQQPKYPLLLGWLSDPEHMALAKDDMEIQKQLSHLITSRNASFGTRLVDAVGEGLKTLTQSQLETYKTVSNRYLDITDAINDTLGLPAPLVVDREAETLRAEIYSDFLDGIINSDFLEPSPLGRLNNQAAKQWLLDWASNSPQMVVSVLLARKAGAKYGAAFIGSLIFGSKKRELTELGVENDRADQAAFADAFLQSGVELLPLGMVRKIPGITNFPAFMVGLLKASGFESGTEWFQKYIEVATLIWGVAQKEGNTLEEQLEIFWDRFWQTTKEGIYEASLILPTVVGSAAVSIPAHITRNAVLNDNSAFWKRFNDFAAKSKLRKRSPTEFAKLMDDQLEKSDKPKSIFISPDALKQAANFDRAEIDNIVKKLDLGDQMAEAEIMGVDLEISSADFAAHLAGTDIGVALTNDVAFERGGLTLNQQAENKKTILEDIDKSKRRREWLADDVEVPHQVLAMREKLMMSKKEGGQGKSAEAADTELAIWLAASKALSKQSEETTQEWFDRVNPVLEIGGEAVEIEDLLKQVDVVGRSWDSPKGKRTVIGIINTAKGPRLRVALEGKESEFLDLIKPEELEAEIVFDEKAAVSREKVQKEARTAQEEQEAIAAEKNDTNGFAEQFSATRAGSIRKTLSKSLQRKGEVKSVRDWVRQLVEEGWRVKGDRLTAPEGAFLDKRDITKTGVDYAKYLSQALPAETFEQSEEEAVRGAVTFSDSQTLINLFATANMSTLSHEAIHVFVTDMKRTYDLGLGDEQFRKDYESLLKFADGKMDRVGQEKIAPVWLKWLETGKAPSVELMGAFQRFKAWLSALYKNVRSLGFEVTDELRRVFERMLASERDIQQVRDLYDAEESLIELYKKLSPEQKKVLTDKREKAKLNSLDIQVQKYMNSYMDALGGKTAANARATEMVDALPVYKALAEIKELKGLSMASVKENYGESVVEGLEEKGLIKNKGGTSLGEMAVKHGFESEEALLDELLAAETRGEAIKKLTEETLAKVEREIRAELGRQEVVPGEEAYHNDAQLSFLIAEANILAAEIEKLEGPEAEARRLKKLEARMYRDTADRLIREKKVSVAARYDRYAATEKKYDKQFQKALSEDNLPAAYEAKKMQILNHAMVQAAVRARDIKQKGEKRYKTEAFKSALNKTENAFAEVATDLAFTYGLSTIEPASKNKTIDLSKLDEGLDEITPEWIPAKKLPEDFKNWRDLTMQRFIELDEAIQSIIHYGRDKTLSLEDELYKTIRSLADGSIKSMDNLPDKDRSEESVKDAALDKLDGLLAWVVNTEFEFRRLDDYVFEQTGLFGPLGKLFNVGVAARVDHIKAKKATFLKTEADWNAFYETSKRLEEVRGGKFFDIPGVETPEIMKKAIPARKHFTAERVISAVLNMGTDKNYGAMIKGYGFSDQEMNLIAGELEASELKNVQNIWDATEKLFPAYDAAHFRVYNRHLTREEPRSFTVISADGKTVEMKGGYYPLDYDHGISTKSAQLKEDDALANRRSSVLRTVKLKDSAIYARKEGVSLPPRLELNVWFTHVNDVTQYMTHVEYMRDLNRLTLDNEWRAKVQAKAGKAAYNKIREWVQFQARPERRIKDGFDRVLEHQRRMATLTILGLNVPVAAKQRISMINLASEIGWKWVIEGYKNVDMKGSLLGLTSSEAYQKMTKMSGYMNVRSNRFDREAYDASRKMKPLVKKFNLPGIDKDFVWADVQDLMLEVLLMNDRATVLPGWTGALSKYMAEVATPDMTQDQKVKNAIEYADAKIRDTQPSALPFDLNALQRTEGPLRTFIMFMTWQFKFGNRVIGKVREYRNGAITTRQFTRHVLHEWVFTHWTSMLISSLIVGGKLPEWWEWFSAPVEGAVAWIPIVRDIPRGVKYRTLVGASPAFEGANRIMKAGISTWDWMTDDGEFSRVLWDIGRATEAQLGVPALNVVKEIDRAVKHVVGEK